MILYIYKTGKYSNEQIDFCLTNVFALDNIIIK